ncbi:MAG: AAA family ATPase [Solobacterium sp.]|nr:AAA family ATPase [Solobacterium sp.]MDD6955739.1 AAA family ATPase [Solobacterium sp.]
MKNVHDEKEKLMAQFFGNSRTLDINETMKTLDSIDSELNRLIEKNNSDIRGMSSFDADSLKKQMESDLDVKLDVPETVTVGKASKDVFDKIKKEMKDEIISQDEAIDNLVNGFNRPYITGYDPRLIRNTVFIYGPKGSGRHLLVETALKKLKANGLVVDEGIYTLDMKRYSSASSESIFIQDLYAGLNSREAVILVENFEEANVVFNRMLSELSLNGSIVLAKRYTLNKNQLVEASTALNKQIVDTLNGNNKTLIFISEKGTNKLLDIYGKSFVENIRDIVKTVSLNNEEIKEICLKMVNDFELKAERQVEIDVQIDNSYVDYLISSYEPGKGVYSIKPILDKTYDLLVDAALKEDKLEVIRLKYNGSVFIEFNNKSMELKLDDSEIQRKEIEEELNDIVGLDEVKTYLNSLEQHLKISKLRAKKGLKTAEVSKHMIFTGNPGTGKTTIARIVSKMMKVAGVLENGQLVEVSRSDLVGKYVGHTAPLTMSVVNSALGGVLFIDEAYSLYRGKDDSFGLEAIDTLVKAMEDHRDDLIVILAGYKKEMESFLDANSGLKSRFANIINFPDYTGEQMLQIAQNIARGKDYVIDEEASAKLLEYFTMVQSKEDSTSGNGRLARNVVEAAILKQSRRVLMDENADISLLKQEDFDVK